jgi:amidohydrolase
MKNDAFEKKIEVALEKERENIINFRRYFHENPERSGKEYNTQKKVLEVLGSYGIEGKSIYETGVVATIKGEKPGKTIAIRADMDALGLQDEITKPYRSKVDGVCHGCGHDGHTAALLGIAKSFNDNKNELA